jgi:hypothetical protein
VYRASMSWSGCQQRSKHQAGSAKINERPNRGN